MEPTNHPFRKEHDLPNLHNYVPILIFQGCTWVLLVAKWIWHELWTKRQFIMKRFNISIPPWPWLCFCRTEQWHIVNTTPTQGKTASGRVNIMLLRREWQWTSLFFCWHHLQQKPKHHQLWLYEKIVWTQLLGTKEPIEYSLRWRLCKIWLKPWGISGIQNVGKLSQPFFPGINLYELCVSLSAKIYGEKSEKLFIVHYTSLDPNL